MLRCLLTSEIPQVSKMHFTVKNITPKVYSHTSLVSLLKKSEFHSHWRLASDDLMNWAVKRVNLFKLCQVELSWAKLSQVEQSWAKLSQVELSWAKLSQAEPNWANLRWAELTWAKLSRKLSRVEPNWAKLSWTILGWTELSHDAKWKKGVWWFSQKSEMAKEEIMRPAYKMLV